MDNYLNINQQEINESLFSKANISKLVREELLSNKTIKDKIIKGVKLLNDWIKTDYYESKNKRLQHLKSLDLNELVETIIISIGSLTKPEFFVSVAAQLSNKLGFKTKLENIQTISEVLAVVCQTDLFDIHKTKKGIQIHSRMQLKNTTIRYIENATYLPPMVCEPLEVTNNKSNTHLTLPPESLILGRPEDFHDGNICLDVINKMNKVALSINKEFLKTCEELPNPDTPLDKEQLHNWNVFKKQSYFFYTHLCNQTDHVYLTHKVDKRGRLYSQGYHINTQATPFKKAMLELANKELVYGEL